MELYFLRHGKAVDRGASGYEDDDKRPLTKEGIAEMKIAAFGISKLVPQFDVILTSPLERAYHTALIVSETFKEGGKPQVFSELAPGTRAEDLFVCLAKHTNKERILLVGHEPDLGEWASLLLGAPKPSIEFKKGAICRIDFSGEISKGEGTLIWSIPPKILAILGK